MGMVLMERIQLDTMVTVVDAELFEEYFQSDKMASRDESPQLFREEQDMEMEEWMKDIPSRISAISMSTFSTNSGPSLMAFRFCFAVSYLHLYASLKMYWQFLFLHS